MNKYYFFLDETGDHGLTYVDPDFPLFLLCGSLFSENELLKTKEPYTHFDVVKEKIYCGRKREIEGFGLKVFP